MEKYITKTSAQAKIQSAQQSKDTACPECGGHSLGTTETKQEGSIFFRTKRSTRKNYRCIKCRCEWSTGWVTK